MKTASMLLAGCAILTGCTSTSQGPHTSAARCKDTNEEQIASLFERWNQSLQTGDPHRVAANYAARSILLPTVSDTPRLTPAEKEEYFREFLKKRPSGKIDMRFVEIDCNSAVDAGLYTFTFAQSGEVVRARYTFTYRWDGAAWLITSHHSSAMPENKAVLPERRD